MSQFDLSFSMVPWLDRHMVITLLDFLATRNLYSPVTVQKAKFEAYAGTKMVDVAIQQYKDLTALDASAAPDTSLDALTAKRTQVLQDITSLKEACGPLLDAIAKANLSSARGSLDFSFESVSAKHKATRSHVEALYEYAQLSFATGQYVDASDYLFAFRLLSANDDLVFNALWGKLAAEVLIATESQDWATAVEDARALREAIEARAAAGKTPLTEQVQQRAWFMHWCLFLAFSSPAGRTLFAEIAYPHSANEGRYFSAVLLVAPWMLRYVCAAAVCASKLAVPGTHAQPGLQRRSPAVRDLLRVLDSDAVTYADPVTGFLKALLVSFNLEAAAAALRDCRDSVFPNDFFLRGSAFKIEFLDAARALVIDTAARVTTRIEVPVLLESLKLTDIVPAAEPAAAAEEPAVASNATILAAAAATSAGSDLPAVVVSPAIMRTGSVQQAVRDRARNVLNKTNVLVTALQKKSVNKDN
jgi:translation initiation factor 3 subunit E